MFHKSSLTPGKARCHTKTAEHISKSRDELSAARAPPKRRKITRACDRCRLQRIKCDEQKPCARCISSEVECIVSYAHHGAAASPHGSDASPLRDEPSAVSGVIQEPSVLFPLTISAVAADLPVYFDIPLRPSDLASHIQRLFANGFTSVEGASHTIGSLFPQLPYPAIPSGEIPFVSEPLTRTQRSRYLHIFWDSCHPLLHIMSEMDFVELEATSPATTPETYSVENALLDAVTAIGIQHGHATGLDDRLVLPLQESTMEKHDHAGWVGFEQFHRCRERMRTNTEVTLQALRCHVLMIVYLMRGYAFRDAYNMLGITVRKAYVAELQRPPPSHLTENEKISRMQLWWVVFSLDLQCSLQLSMPAACQKSLVKCPLPSSNALAHYLSPRDRNEDDLTTCAYSTILVDLAIIVTDIGARVSTADLLDDSSDDSAVLEHLASELAPSLHDLENWRDRLPAPLVPSHTSKDARFFDLGGETSLPLWLQRQRILLELHYHNAYVLILRPFVSLCFAHFTELSGESSSFDTELSLVQHHISSAIKHATDIIDFIFTFSSRSEVLYGWPEVLQPLWNATMVIVTYVYANSLNPVARKAAQSLARADLVFRCFSTTSTAATSAKEVVHSLVQQLEDLQNLSV